MQNIKEQLIEKTRILKENRITVPKLEARLLLAKVLKKDLNWTFLNLDYKISKKNTILFDSLVKKRINKIPTSYILGEKEFWGKNYKVNRHTLIPRPETELIISAIKKKYHFNSSLSVLDLGTGTGCILLSILSEFPKAFGIGTDIKSNIIKVAEFNSKRHCLLKRSFFSVQNWNLHISFKQLLVLNKKLYKKNKFDLVVSNPPYILRSKMKNLMEEVKFEPQVALDGGYNGLKAYKNIFSQIKSVLSKNGSILFEIDPPRVKNIKKILEKEGFKKIIFLKDFSNRRRVVLAK